MAEENAPSTAEENAPSTAEENAPPTAEENAPSTAEENIVSPGAKDIGSVNRRKLAYSEKLLILQDEERWRPPKGFKFPRRQQGNKQRAYTTNWEASYSWLR